MTKLELSLKTAQYSPIFKGVALHTIEGLLKDNCQILSFSKGDFIASAEDKCLGLYLLTEGTVVGETIDENGKTIQLEQVKTPQPIALSFIYGKGEFPAYIRALSDVTILLIKKAHLNKVLKENEKILNNFLTALSSRSQFLTKRISFLTSNSIKKKLAKYIVDVVGDEKVELIFPNSQERMAEFFGVTRPAFARVLKKLKDDGFIESKGRKVAILNLDGLKNIINEV